MDFLFQIRSYESEADEDELSILEAPCIKHISDYSGVEVVTPSADVDFSEVTVEDSDDDDLEIVAERKNHARRDPTCKDNVIWIKMIDC